MHRTLRRQAGTRSLCSFNPERPCRTYCYSAVLFVGYYSGNRCTVRRSNPSHPATGMRTGRDWDAWARHGSQPIARCIRWPRCGPVRKFGVSAVRANCGGPTWHRMTRRFPAPRCLLWSWVAWWARGSSRCRARSPTPPDRSAPSSHGSSPAPACTCWRGCSSRWPRRKPDLDAGVFAYAKAGFGDYPGFLSAFGYWIGSCIGNVSYWVLIKSTLGAFFPVFGDGNTVDGNRGRVGRHLALPLHDPARDQAGGLHQHDRHGRQDHPDPGVHRDPDLRVQDGRCSSANLYRRRRTCEDGRSSSRCEATMLVTVFVFLGIEGASVYSRYAKERSDVGMATILGFIVVTGADGAGDAAALRGAAAAPTIAGMRQPSMATVLEAVVGHWGAVFVSVGLHRLGAGRLPRLVADLRRSAVRRGEDQGHAVGLRQGEREQAFRSTRCGSRTSSSS